MPIIESYQNKNLIFCTFVPAGLKAYPAFFAEHFHNFYYIELAFHHVRSNKASRLICYSNNKIIKEYNLPRFSPLGKAATYLFMPFIYLIHFIAILKAVRIITGKHQADIFIGVNFFCAFCGIILKKIHYIKNVIYRVLDFYPRPDKGIYKYLIPFFYKIDKFCLKNTDFTWFTTNGHIRGRQNAGYFDPSLKYDFIPLGVTGDLICNEPIENINNHSLVYLGIISKKHGLDIIFSLIPVIKKQFPDFKLHIIGSGPDEKLLKRTAEQDHFLNDAIIFHGYLPETSPELKKIVGTSSLALAIYDDDPFGFMQYTEPAKAKLYLSYGTPVLITRIPDLAVELHDAGVGIAVDYNPDQIKNAIINYFKNKKQQSLLKKNIPPYINKFDTSFLLYNIMIKTLDYLNKENKL